MICCDVSEDVGVFFLTFYFYFFIFIAVVECESILNACVRFDSSGGFFWLLFVCVYGDTISVIQLATCRA